MKKLAFLFLSLGSIFGCPAQTTSGEIMERVENSIRLKVFQEQNRYEILNEEKGNAVSGPEVEFEHLWAQRGLTKWNLSVTQNFDWPGLYRARSKTIRSKERIAEKQTEAMLLDMKVDAKKLLVQIGFAQRRIENVERMLANINELDRHLETALSSGSITILDKKKTQLEIVRLKIELNKLTDEKHSLIAELESLLGEPLDTENIDWKSFTVAESLKTQDFYMSKVSQDPSLLASVLLDESAEQAMNVERLSLYPGFGVGYRHETEEGSNYNGFAVSVQLPTWNFKKTNQAARQFVLSTRSQTEMQKKLLLNRLSSEYRSAAALRENIREMNASGIDGSYLSLLTEAREGGELTVLDYLLECNYINSVTTELLDLEERYCLLLASLNRYSD